MNTLLKNNTTSKTIGLTGGIGSGKSTVAKIFKAMGIPVFNSDVAAKLIVNSNKDIIDAIKNRFGDVYIDGILDSSKLAHLVFNDAEALKELNNIVHPKVGEAFQNWMDQHQDFPFLIKEAAILIESGAYKSVDEIVLVTAPKKLRINRVISRDGSTKEAVLGRIGTQLSDDEKNKYANYVICNDGEMMLVPQVLKIIEQLKSPSI